MRGFSASGLAVVALLAAGPAFAFGAPETNRAWPTPHQLEARNADDGRQPYAMTYSEEMARRLVPRKWREG